MAAFSVAQEYDLQVYIEYLPKDNRLRAMRVKIKEINDEFVYVVDQSDDELKRLNYNRMFVVGLEVKDEAAA